MIKRSECRCICHNDFGPIVMHVVPCCEEDDNLSVGILDIGAEIGMQPINETHSAIKSAVAKRNEEEYKRIWNAAIEAAANEAKKYLNSINLKGVKTHAAIMRLKK